MLAELIAIVVVTLPVLGPGAYLLHVAWRRGGAARLAAGAVLIAAGALVVWLFSPLGPELSEHERIVQFVGASGILFMVVGGLVIAGIVVGKLRARRRSDDGA